MTRNLSNVSSKSPGLSGRTTETVKAGTFSALRRLMPLDYCAPNQNMLVDTERIERPREYSDDVYNIPH